MVAFVHETYEWNVVSLEWRQQLDCHLPVGLKCSLRISSARQIINRNCDFARTQGGNYRRKQ